MCATTIVFFLTQEHSATTNNFILSQANCNSSQVTKHNILLLHLLLLLLLERKKKHLHKLFSFCYFFYFSHWRNSSERAFSLDMVVTKQMSVSVVPAKPKSKTWQEDELGLIFSVQVWFSVPNPKLELRFCFFVFLKKRTTPELESRVSFSKSVCDGAAAWTPSPGWGRPGMEEARLGAQIGFSWSLQWFCVVGFFFCLSLNNRSQRQSPRRRKKKKWCCGVVFFVSLI